MDRISQLPEPILQRILCHLSPKQAFQSCALSKSWRHICSTRPKFEFRESFFNGNQETFFSFIDATLSRCRDQNISLPEFLLDISSKVGSEFVPILESWIPLVLLGMGVKKFTLNFTFKYLFICHRMRLFYFHLSEDVFKAESLEELHLTGCQINHSDKLMSNRLRTLSLTSVRFSGVTLGSIISTCPLIEHVTIKNCYGLGTTKVNKAPKLKHLDLSFCADGGSHSIEIDVPSIECIRISNPLDWIHSASYLSFTHLKSLYLSYVRLSENSFHRFSVDFGCLEELTLIRCHGFEEFNIASCSIKSLSLDTSELRKIKSLSLHTSDLKKIAVDVPNIRSFELSCASLPSISFTTTSSVWKSKISVIPSQCRYIDCSSTLLDIYELHKATLYQSEFSLHIAIPWGVFPENYVGSYPLVVVENLTFCLGNYLSSHPPEVVNNLPIETKHCILYLEAWLGHLLCLFRPRSIEHSWYANPKDDFERADNQLVEYLRGILLEDDQQGLEQVLIESSDEHGEEVDCGLSENLKQKIQFRLKWRE